MIHTPGLPKSGVNLVSGPSHPLGVAEPTKPPQIVVSSNEYSKVLKLTVNK